MKIGDAELKRGTDGVYTYTVKLFVDHIVTVTDVHTWQAGKNWSKQAIEGEFIDAEEIGRDQDESDEDIEYVRFEKTMKRQTQITRKIQVTDGQCRGEFDQERIKTLLRKEGIQPENVKDIDGYVGESTVFLHG